MLPNDVVALLERGEKAIREGMGPQLRPELSQINTAEIPKESRLPLANLCRRVGLITTAMRLLSPRIAEEPKPAELAEYSVLLQRMGALQEAIWTLEKVDMNAAPEALMYKAFCHFSQWEHGLAIPLLRQYLENPLSDYARLIGKLNLAAAHSIDGQWETAFEYAIECQTIAKASGHWRIFANTLEMKAEIVLQSDGSAERALEYLDEAAGILNSHKSFDQLYVWKWKAYLEAKKNRSLKGLEEFRSVALERREWESVREADLLALRIEPTHERMNYLTVGTPHAAYRKRIERLVPEYRADDFYLWGKRYGKVFDVLTGKIDGAFGPKAGGKIHLMIELLARDFYRPFRLGHLFAELYPQEKFDIFSSPARVHQLLKRTRRWLSDNQVAMTVKETAGAYALDPGPEISLRVPLNRVGLEGFAAHLHRLRTLYPRGKIFSARDACQALGIKRSTIKSLMAWARNGGELVLIGQSSSSRYRFHS